MQDLVNKKVDKWIHPWNVQKFDNITDRDDRYFALLLKGALSWLTRNIVLYDKGIRHFIFNTGSAYMYLESNGYEFSWNETSGEDQVYMHMPRCIVEIGNITVPTEELTAPFVRGVYERRLEDGSVQGFNAEIRRLPIELNLTLKYVLSNFNESIVLLQELIDKIIFQRFFRIVYLGQVIDCSIEFPNDFTTQINKIDMTSAETNQKNIELSVKICSNYPIVNEKTETPNSNIISKFIEEANTKFQHELDVDERFVDTELTEEQKEIVNSSYILNKKL